MNVALARLLLSAAYPLLAHAASAAHDPRLAALALLDILLILLVVVIVLMAMCSHDACRDERRAFGAGSAEYQQCKARSGSGTTFIGTGGSWGGYSSGGGGHK